MIHQLTKSTECVATERITRKSIEFRVGNLLFLHAFSLISIGRYIRSLQEKIADLESRGACETRDPSLHNDSALESDEVLEQAHYEQEYTPHSDQRASEVLDTQSLIVPTCEAPAITFPSPLHGIASNTSPIPGDHCGHSSLLIGVLATLTSGNPCGIAPQRSDARREINVSSPIAEKVLHPSHQIDLPSHVEDTLVQIYLERVNPRYPFLHVDIFSGWYKAWKTRRHSGPTTGRWDRWKDFIVIMVRQTACRLPRETNIGML